MLKKKLLIINIALVGFLGLSFIGNVNAIDEPMFENEECITDSGTWLNTAKTEYQFNEEDGTFTTSGETAQEHRQAAQTGINVVFYEVSSDGKTLTAYVPSYPSTVGSEITRPYVEEAGISTDYDCENVIKITKTTSESGETPSDSDDPSGADNPSDADDAMVCDEGYTYDENTGKCVADNITKIQSPNTASPASIAAVAIGTLMVIGSVVVFLKKNNKLNFGKKNN